MSNIIYKNNLTFKLKKKLIKANLVISLCTLYAAYICPLLLNILIECNGNEAIYIRRRFQPYIVHENTLAVMMGSISEKKQQQNHCDIGNNLEDDYGLGK